MPTIVLLSKGLARYRYTFTEHFAAALPADVKVIACPLGDDLWEVDFPALKAQQQGRVSYRAFPTDNATLAAWQPSLIAIMEYSLPMLRVLAYARLHRIPVVVFTELGLGLPRQSHPWHLRLRHRLAAHFTQGQVALAPAARQPFGAAHRPVIFAPHSIDTAEFKKRAWSDIKPQHCTLLCVAQYTSRKGQDLLAKALALVMAQHSGIDFQLRLIGILDPGWLHQVIAAAGIAEHCVVLGPVQGQALLDEFLNADIFVLPSRFDTYGVVTQEACATGLPVIISKHAGSSSNLVHDGKSGYVIDPEDTAAFAEKLALVMSQPHTWPTLGARSRSLAESYCVRRTGANVAAWMQAFLPAG